MLDWKAATAEWEQVYPLKYGKPVTQALLMNANDEVGPLPEDLITLYGHCNGLSAVWFSILPVYAPLDISRTWDSIERANNPQTTSHFEGDVEFLKRFLVFARLDVGLCAVYDRADSSIWYEEDDELHLTTLDLSGFIKTCLREVRDF